MQLKSINFLLYALSRGIKIRYYHIILLADSVINHKRALPCYERSARLEERAARSEANLIRAVNQFDLYSVLPVCYDAEKLVRCAHNTMYKAGLLTTCFVVKW